MIKPSPAACKRQSIDDKTRRPGGALPRARPGAKRGVAFVSFTIASWNINSVRLRLPAVLRFLAEARPDILCLQETKCPNELFPLQPLAAAGYAYAALNGQKGYHGVATLARRPFIHTEKRLFCGRNDCRHIETLIEHGGKKIRIHNVYAPAGGDETDPAINPKFAHKLQFLQEMHSLPADKGDGSSALLAGDLNIAPLENDVWSHKQMLKVVSHTPVETSGLISAQRAGGWVDMLRAKVPAREKLYTWWSYRARDWAASNRGRRLDHIWASPDMLPLLDAVTVFRAARDWEKPSDHVPVAAHFRLGRAAD